MVRIGDIGERQLIEDFGTFIRPEGRVGPGDDAAVLGRDVVVSTDVVTFERHLPAGMTYEQFGWYAAAASFSDLAAMGARPTGILAALALPPSLDAQAAYDIMSGVSQCAEFCGTGIAGGDTKPGPGVVATTAIGSMDGRTPMLRSGARQGDVVAVTGPLGGPAAGFMSLDLGIEAEEARNCLYVPVPRVAEGAAMAASGAVTSCMDLSDGLGTALNTLCAASGVGMEIETSFIPVGPSVEEMAAASGRGVEDLLLGWGGEYELVFTADRDRLDRLYREEVEFSIIGVVNDTGAPHLNGDGGRRVIPYGEYRARRGRVLRARRGLVRLRAVPAPLPHRAGEAREVRLPQGGRGHARGVLLREGVLDLRGPRGEEAPVPLHAWRTLLLGRKRRVQHVLPALPELLDLPAGVREEAQHLQVARGARRDVQARGAGCHRVHVQRADDLVRVHPRRRQGGPRPAHHTCDERPGRGGAAQGAVPHRRRREHRREGVHGGVLHGRVRSPPGGRAPLSAHRVLRGGAPRAHVPRHPRAQRLARGGEVVLRVGGLRALARRARPFHQVPPRL